MFTPSFEESVSIRHRPTWNELVALEPGLADVAAEARRRRAMRQGGLNAWYGYGRRWSGDGLKGRVSALVGWNRRNRDWRVPYGGPEILPDQAGTVGWVSVADKAAWDERGPGQEQSRRLAAVRQDDGRERAVLWTSEAYDVAYEHVLHLLWSCRRKCCKSTPAA